MNLGRLKTLIAAYLKKSVSDFGEYGVDVLSWAINAARDDVQRDIDFEYAKTLVELTVDLASGTSLTASLRYGTTQPVTIKKVLKAWYVNDVSGPFDGVSIPYIPRWSDADRIAVISNTYNESFTRGYSISSEKYAVQMGDLIYLKGFALSGTQKIALDVVAWLPALTAASDQDFITVYCNSFVVLRAIQYCNFYLMHDERVQISDEAVKTAYASVLKWHSSITPEMQI